MLRRLRDTRFGAQSMAAKYQHPRASDPYRVVFEHLAVGAAHCRLIVERDRVVAVEVLDANRAFEPVRDILPRLHGACSRVRAVGGQESLRLQDGGSLLSVSIYPIGGEVDEVMVVIENITGKEQLEQRSRESQLRFEQAFHSNAAAMVIAHRSDLRIIDANARWLEMFAATRDEVIGRTSLELGLITETNARTRISEHRQFTQGYDTELELTTRNGEKLTVLASARPIELAEGDCTLTTLIDITRRKHAEEAFVVAFSASPAGMMLVEVDSDTVVAVNDRLLEMTGDRREDFVGRRVSELTLTLTPPRDELLAEIARSGRIDSAEVELASRRGPGIWTLASIEVVTLHGMRHRLSAFTDITARKRVERLLMTQYEVGRRLAETSGVDAAIPLVLEALCRGEGWDWGAVWLPGPDKTTLRCIGTWWRPELACDATDPTADTALLPGELCRRVLATGAMDKAVLDPAICARSATVAGGLRHAIAFPILRGTAVLGVIALAARQAELVLDPAERGLFDSVGRLLGLFVERTRAEAALRELNIELERRVLERTRELETSNRDLEAFSSSVSHDLRAPLRAIVGFSNILLDDFGDSLPGEARDLLGRIDAAGRRLRSLVNDLLAFARLGRDELQRSRVELDPLVRAVIEELLAGRDLGDRLDLQVMPLGSCHADPSLLRTVWTNLIDNALKYSQTRGRMVIEIGREVRDRAIVYYVRDNGVGFDMKYAARLFGVFQRLHPASEFEGTGIGLANVRRIVERHHGHVAATSEQGRGSRFEFTLGPEGT
jgi:PAS domain S-box-containing protein